MSRQQTSLNGVHQNPGSSGTGAGGGNLRANTSSSTQTQTVQLVPPDSHCCDPDGHRDDSSSTSSGCSSVKRKSVRRKQKPNASAFQDQHQHATAASASTAQVLRLPLRRKNVRWSSETHNNEWDGKKSSKICCIYHAPKEFGESSSESSGGAG
mmetsp:Transcript_238/g.417  ORF Transcript_238/g.417 Transcript_238/m.417 type:complete len:154 (+) Transcript_238:123-584(+)